MQQFWVSLFSFSFLIYSFALSTGVPFKPHTTDDIKEPTHDGQPTLIQVNRSIIDNKDPSVTLLEYVNEETFADDAWNLITTKGAQQLNVIARDLLRRSLLQGSIKGLKKAYIYFMVAAANDCPEALCNMAFCLERGYGVEKDEEQAFNCYQNLAEKYVYAKAALARCKLEGIGGDKNEKEAVQLLAEAAGERYSYAQYVLGCCLLTGTGIEKDEKVAVKFFEAAAKNGLKDAMLELYRCYWNGVGVEVDKTIAFDWFTKAEHTVDKSF